MNSHADDEDVTFMNLLRDGVILVDDLHTITFANQSALGLLGYSRSTLIGSQFEDALQLQSNGNRVTKVTSPITKAKKKIGVYSSDSEPEQRLTMGRNDRSLIPVQISVMPGRSEGGFCVIFHDGSADEKIDQAKSEFVALVSHQLRTPVNIISWYLEKLLSEKKGTLNEVQRDYMTEIETSNKRVVDLVQSIVNVSRTDLSRLKHKHEAADVRAILTRVLDGLHDVSTHKRITTTLHVEDGSYSLQDSDQELISVILHSVILNALRYTRPEGTVDTVLCEVREHQLLSEDENIIARKRGVLITVKDTGIGIPDEEKQSIFTKLYRASNVQALDVTGVGLGLYIANSFITVLGGNIWFTSDLRKGSTFCIYIPCEQIGIL